MQNRNDIQHSTFRIPTSARRRAAMTLIELLIVIVIIGVLISAVLVASTSLIGKSKARNTQTVLQLVADAAEQFKRSETEKPTITRDQKYKKRYGLYPPDELEVFSTTPPAVTAVPYRLATPTGSTIVPAEFPNMRFYTDKSDDDRFEHRDLAALIVAIESQGGEAAAILDRIADRNRSTGSLATTDGKPNQYLSRPAGINPDSINDAFGEEDLQIRYILDDWGNPVSYMSQRDFVHDKEAETRSNNHPGWNEASTEFVRINGGQPVILSYGANGKDQLTRDAMEPEGKASMVGDFADHNISEPFNDDNVYLNDQLREKLFKGIEEHDG